MKAKIDFSVNSKELAGNFFTCTIDIPDEIKRFSWEIENYCVCAIAEGFLKKNLIIKPYQIYLIQGKII